MLHAQLFDGSHTGGAIGGTVTGILQSWNLGKEKIHLIVSDNAANMVKGLSDTGLPHIG